MPEYTPQDIASHKSRDDLWIAIHGKGNLSLILLNYPFPVSKLTKQYTT